MSLQKTSQVALRERVAAEEESQSCWKCERGKILLIPYGGGEYVDCPPGNWKGHSCAVRLLDTIPLWTQPAVSIGHCSSSGLGRHTSPVVSGS